MHKKKVISKTSLTNMSKSEKSAFFRHIFANNFFLLHFFKTFRFCKKKFFFRPHLYFFRTLTVNAQETAQKNGKSFFINVSYNFIMQPSKGLHNQVVKIIVPYYPYLVCKNVSASVLELQ